MPGLPLLTPLRCGHSSVGCIVGPRKCSVCAQLRRVPWTSVRVSATATDSSRAAAEVEGVAGAGVEAGASGPAPAAAAGSSSSSTSTTGSAAHHAQPTTTAPAAGIAYARQTPASRAVSAAAAVACAALVGCWHDAPALRLALLTYMLWATGEWVVHRYLMHAKKGSLADRAVHLNSLHMIHHLDTEKDMSMREGYSLDALYFHLPNTAVQVAVGSLILLGLDTTFSLDIPLGWLPLSAVAFAVAHNVAWNTMHLDMHEVSASFSDGLPGVPYSRHHPLLRPYVQWVFSNHTTHHDIGGGGNYNVIGCF
ncbi:hypothetical protein FOA52_013645 [Chlamydomonas sp. UWO 241]|nr:hypothetical protein FOA52_013645 [Chlamydomonas sp. UWO 241]